MFVTQLYSSLNSNVVSDREYSNSQLNSEILADGEYYVFGKQEGEKIYVGYTYTTWCGSPCGMHMSFSSAELGKPLPLIRTAYSQHDKGQLKTFSFDSRNPRLIDDVYNRALSWLNQMQRGLKHPQLDESASCTPAVIQVNRGVLSSFCGKEDYLIRCHLSALHQETDL